MTREHEHQVHPPHLGIGDVAAILGIAALGFALGRASSPSKDCADRLAQANTDLLVCQTRPGNTSLYLNG